MPKAPSRKDEGIGSTPLVEVGELLRAARVEQGRTVEEVAESLRIKEEFVRAMEEGAFENLPGLVFMVGFARNYADLLDVPSDPIARTVRQACALFERDRRIDGAPVLPERSFPAAVVIGASALVLVGLYLGWQRYSGLPPEVIEQGVEIMYPEDAGLPDGGAPESAPPQAPPPAGGTPAFRNVFAQGRPSGGAPASFAQDPAAPGGVPESGPPAGPAAEGAVEVAALDPAIVIRADADCWIQVERPDGSVVESRILQAGDAYPVPPEPGLRLIAGNAGGITLTVAGEALPRLGGSGETIRNVLLEPEALRARFR